MIQITEKGLEITIKEGGAYEAVELKKAIHDLIKHVDASMLEKNTLWMTMTLLDSMEIAEIDMRKLFDDKPHTQLKSA